MTEEHLITPPPDELAEQWLSEPRYSSLPTDGTFVVKQCRSLADDEINNLVIKAARWGADQELEACRLWVSENESSYDAEELVECRRPKPKTLKEMKERGMKALLECYRYIPDDLYYEIKKVIESLPDES